MKKFDRWALIAGAEVGWWTLLGKALVGL